MAKSTSTGFVSLYRTTDKLEAAYLVHVDPKASNGLKTVDGKQVNEFVATKKIEKAVDVYQKTPSKALLPVSSVTGLSAPAGATAPAAAKAPAKRRGRPARKGGAKRKKARSRKAAAKPAGTAASAPAPAAAKAPAKRRARPAKAKATKAKAAAKAKPATPGRRGRKPSVTPAALADMAALIKAGKTKKDVDAMLKQKYKLTPASPTYYVWKRRALGK